MSIKWLNQEVGYYRGPACIGLVKGKTGWIMIDTGVDEDVPKKVLKLLSLEFPEDQVNVSAIINTHAHADHIGGNAWLQKKFGCLIWASSRELPYIENPSFEPHYLFSAASPKALNGKFFNAPPSRVGSVIPNDDEVDICIDGIDLRFFDLSGHSPGMIGVSVGEDVLFCGDLIYTEAILNKHPLLFQYDYLAYRKALEWITKASFGTVVMTHGGETVEAKVLAEKTLTRIDDNYRLILSFLESPIDEFSIHLRLSDTLSLNEDFGGWHLNHAVIRSFLQYGMEHAEVSWQNGKYHKVSKAV